MEVAIQPQEQGVVYWKLWPSVRTALWKQCRQRKGGPGAALGGWGLGVTRELHSVGAGRAAPGQDTQARGDREGEGARTCVGEVRMINTSNTMKVSN